MIIWKTSIISKCEHSNNDICYSNKLLKTYSGTFSLLNWRLIINTGGWVGLWETGVVGRGGEGEFSLSCSLWIGIAFSAIEPIWKPLKNEGQKKCTYAWSKDSVYIQLLIFPVELNIVHLRHLIPAGVPFLCAYKWEHFIPHLHSPFLVKLTGAPARRLFKMSCPWDSNKLQAATGVS